MSKATILSIKQNLILSKKRNKNILLPLCSFVVVAIMLCLSIENITVQQVANSMCYVYNPVNSLYSDNSSIIFASTGVLAKENLDFSVPIISTKSYIESNGDLIFEVTNSIMIKSVESGVVEEVGVTLDGVKFIKISHTTDIYSLIENVDIVGVSEGDIIKKGQDISTAKLGEKITLKFFDKDSQINNMKINQSKILWEK